MATYMIITTREDLDHNYAAVSDNWTYAGQHSSDPEFECWTCETTMPAALERLLDTDNAVVSYNVIAD